MKKIYTPYLLYSLSLSSFEQHFSKCIKKNYYITYKVLNYKKYLKLEILQSLGGLYDGLAFYALHWSYAPSL